MVGRDSLLLDHFVIPGYLCLGCEWGRVEVAKKWQKAFHLLHCKKTRFKEIKLDLSQTKWLLLQLLLQKCPKIATCNS